MSDSENVTDNDTDNNTENNTENKTENSSDQKTETEPVNEYNYYSENGHFIGHSEGISPQEDLFQQAHYVFSGEKEADKNNNTISDIEQDLKNFRKERINTSVSHIGRLMDLNRKIENLEQLLEHTKNEQSTPLKKAG